MSYDPQTDFVFDKKHCERIVRTSPLPVTPDTEPVTDTERRTAQLIGDVYESARPQMRAWLTALEGIRRACSHTFAPKVAPPAMSMATASAQTQSDALNDAITDELVDTRADVKDDIYRFLRHDALYDNARKSTLFARYFEGDRSALLRAMDAVAEDKPFRAICHLSSENGYLDAIKAPMAVRWCGLPVACVDTNVRQATRSFLRNRLDDDRACVEGDTTATNRKPTGGTLDSWEERAGGWVNMTQMGIEGPSATTDKPIASERFLESYVRDRGDHPRPKAQRHKDIQAMYGLVFHTIADVADIPPNAVPTVLFLYNADVRVLQTAVADAIKNYTDGKLDAVAINHINKLDDVDPSLREWDRMATGL